MKMVVCPEGPRADRAGGAARPGSGRTAQGRGRVLTRLLRGAAAAAASLGSRAEVGPWVSWATRRVASSSWPAGPAVPVTGSGTSSAPHRFFPEKLDAVRAQSVQSRRTHGSSGATNTCRSSGRRVHRDGPVVTPGAGALRNVVVVSAEDFVRVAAIRIAWILHEAGSAGDPTSIVLAGGSTPRPVYRALAALPNLSWDGVSIFFSDERAVPPYDPRSNYRMARETLVDRIPVPAERVHRMEAERPDIDQAARDYERVLPENPSLLLLGMGADGRTASILPGSPAGHVRRRVIPVTTPDDPPTGMTLTPPAVLAAKRVLVLVRGGDRAKVAARVLLGDPDPVRCPAALARQGTWLLDSAAASELEAAGDPGG